MSNYTSHTTRIVNGKIETLVLPLSKVRFLNCNDARTEIRSATDKKFKELIQSMHSAGWLLDLEPFTVVTKECAQRIGLINQYPDPYLPMPQKVKMRVLDGDDIGKEVDKDVTEQHIMDVMDVIYSEGEESIDYYALEGYHRFTACILAKAAYPDSIVTTPEVAIRVINVDDLDEFFMIQRADNRRGVIIDRNKWELLKDARPFIQIGAGEVSLYTPQRGERAICENKAEAGGVYAAAMCQIYLAKVGADAIREMKMAKWLPDQKFRMAVQKYIKETFGLKDKTNMKTFFGQATEDQLLQIVDFIKRGPEAASAPNQTIKALDVPTTSLAMNQIKNLAKGGDPDLTPEQALELAKRLTLFVDALVQEHETKVREFLASTKAEILASAKKEA